MIKTMLFLQFVATISLLPFCLFGRELNKKNHVTWYQTLRSDWLREGGDRVKNCSQPLPFGRELNENQVTWNQMLYFDWLRVGGVGLKSCKSS